MLSHFPELARNGLLLLLASLALDLVSSELIPTGQAPLFFSLIASLPKAIFAYSCHRICLGSHAPELLTESNRIRPFLAWTYVGILPYELEYLISACLHPRHFDNCAGGPRESHSADDCLRRRRWT